MQNELTNINKSVKTKKYADASKVFALDDLADDDPQLITAYCNICAEIAVTEEGMHRIMSRHGLSYWHMHTIARNHEWANNELGRALTARAVLYFDRAKEIADSVEEFWDAPVLDAKCNIRLLTKERVSAVNKARLRLDFYARACAQLSPEHFGDNGKEIREIRIAIDNMSKMMLTKTSNNNILEISSDDYQDNQKTLENSD